MPGQRPPLWQTQGLQMGMAAILLALVLTGGMVPLALSDPPEAATTIRELRAAASEKKVYASAFEKGAGDPWSKRQVTKCPSGKHTFLGPFAYGSVTLSLDNLPEHARVRLSFDLMIIMTWDGDANLDNPDAIGPDLFNVTVDRGPRLVHASFVARPSSETQTQSFPGRFPYDHLPAGTGAAESRSLGYRWWGPGGTGLPDDYVYHIERSFAHSGKSLKIAFSGINLQAANDECWGLENVRVEVLPAQETAPLAEAAFGKRWTELGSADPKLFVPAIDALIDWGEPVVTAIRRRLALSATGAAPNLQRINQLIAQLDANAFVDREEATAALRDLGAVAGPALYAAQKNTTSLEALRRINGLLKDLRRAEVENEAGRRLRRAVEILERIGSPKARAGLSDIAGRSGLAAWEAEAAIQRLDGKAAIPTTLDLPPGLPKRTVSK
jgi:hypothetical protein